MKFWKFSTSTLASLLAIVSVTQASGPSSGEAAADPNSAVVKLSASNFTSFLQENPLVLTEFFAPWCGYCKMLAPEFTKAADALNTTHPNIKLAQIDCTTEESICRDHGIKGYPTLKVIKDGASQAAEDYSGPRDAQGISDYMIKQTLPSVQVPASAELLDKLVDEQIKPFVVQVNPSAATNATFGKIADQKRNDYTFISVEDKDLVKHLGSRFKNVDLTKADNLLVVHPGQFDEAAKFEGETIDEETLAAFIAAEVVPYFGDITRDTYMAYMSSPLPLGYYFYKTPEEREAIASDIAKVAKKYRGKINIAGVDATLFGKHAEVINMNPDIVPLFAIHAVAENKKYGVDQAAYPEGPSADVIAKFVDDFIEGKLTPIIKSEDLPTEEEKKANPVVKLVGKNYREILDDVSKDIFVKYYAPWCGHCKKLAPTWAELGEIFGSNKDDAKVIIADIDHTNNDVDVPYDIQGYPTLLWYPANGKLDAKTGLREPVLFEGSRDLEGLLNFVKAKGTLGVDVDNLADAWKSESAEKAAASEAAEKEKAEKEDVVEEEEEVAHDEL
ncbi:Protein disulfide-isomerase [Spathaspora sp. JA1]|nr:Protein disulfide-isomerase [Spathaspora sp. JA1]